MGESILLVGLQVENFQGFSGRQEVELAPITLVFGPNASGKSSISRAIRLVKQTVLNSKTLGFDYDGADVKLDSFERTLYAQKVGPSSASLSVGVTIDLSEHGLELQGLSSVALELKDFGRNGAVDDLAGGLAPVAVTLTLPNGSEFSMHYNFISARWTTVQSVMTDVFFELWDQETAALESRKPDSPKPFGFRDEWVTISGKLANSKSLDRPEFDNASYGAPWSVLIDECLGGYGLGLPHEVLDRRAESPAQPQGFGVTYRLFELRQLAFYYREHKTMDWKETERHLFYSDDVSKDVIRMMLKYIERENVSFEDACDYEIFEAWLETIPGEERVDVDDIVPIFNNQDRFRLTVLKKLFAALSSVISRQLEGILHIASIRPITPFSQELGNGIVAGEYGENVRFWMKRLTDNRYDVKSRTITHRGFPSRLETFVSDEFTGAEVAHDQVGTGLSQLLPVLEAAFGDSPRRVNSKTQSSKNSPTATRQVSTILVEQPELHLHPRMQGDVADMVIDSWRRTGSQFIIETHSENLLLRFQKRIRENEIPADLVRIVYVEPDLIDPLSDTYRRRNIMYNLDLAGNGDVLDPFPISFTSLRIEDLL